MAEGSQDVHALLCLVPMQWSVWAVGEPEPIDAGMAEPGFCQILLRNCGWTLWHCLLESSLSYFIYLFFCLSPMSSSLSLLLLEGTTKFKEAVSYVTAKEEKHHLRGKQA